MPNHRSRMRRSLLGGVLGAVLGVFIGLPFIMALLSSAPEWVQDYADFQSYLPMFLMGVIAGFMLGAIASVLIGYIQSFGVMRSFLLSAPLSLLSTSGWLIVAATSVGALPEGTAIRAMGGSPSAEARPALFAITPPRWPLQGKLLRSDDGGDNWTHVRDLYRELRPATSRVPETDNPVLGQDGRVLGRLFAGEVLALEFSSTYETDRTVFAGASDGLFRSTDGGASWEILLVGEVSTVVLLPSFGSDHTVIAINRGRLMRSKDGGDSWRWLRIYDWPISVAFVLGVGYLVLATASIVVAHRTSGLMEVAMVWRLLWLVSGLGVGIVLVQLGVSYYRFGVGLFGLLILVLTAAAIGALSVGHRLLGLRRGES